MTTPVPPRRGISVRLKLAAGISAVALGVVVAVGTALTEIHASRNASELRHHGELYAQLLGHELEPVVAFGDRLTARDIFRALSVDSDVEGVGVYAVTGELIEGRGDVPAVPADRRSAGMTFVARVVSPEGPEGIAVIRLGTDRLDLARRSFISASVFVAAITAVLAFVFAWLYARRVTRRIEVVADAASRVAAGELAVPPIAAGASDEIGQLAVGFNAMITELRTLFDERERAAATEQDRLTELVAARTRALAASREQYRLIVESTNAIPFTYFPSSEQFSYVGPRAAQLLGYGAGAWLVPGFLTRLIDPADLGRIRSILADSAAEVDTELVVISAMQRPMHVRLIAARGTAGDSTCVRGLILDMTEHRRLQRDLAQAQKLESVGRLAAGVAHEINTPVQFVGHNVQFASDAVTDLIGLIGSYQGLARAVVDGAAPDALAALAADTAAAAEVADLEFVLEQLPRALAQAGEGLDRVTTIVRSMREFAHPREGEHAAVDLNRAIQSTLTVARNEYKYVAELVTELGELPEVTCNVGEINQAMLNIVVNAAHAVGDAIQMRGQDLGRITVTTRRSGDDVLISVADTGGGIPIAVRDRIFDPFFTTKDVGRGTGQGLAIARAAIVERHGGDLTFDTELGVGTTFTIRLPISRHTAPAATLSAAA